MTRLLVAPLLLSLLCPSLHAQDALSRRLALPSSLAALNSVSGSIGARALAGPVAYNVPVIRAARPVPSPLKKTGLSVPAETRVTPLGPANALGGPDVRLDLAALKDRHWAAADGFDTPSGRALLTISFGLTGSPYLAVRAPGWKTPVFHRFEMGMKGDWSIEGHAYRMDFDVSIFRPKVNNFIRIFAGTQDEPFFTRTVAELQKKSYATGVAVSIGGHHYRFFHADDVDSSANPTRPDPRRQGLVFIENAGVGTGGYAAYIVDASMVGPQAAGFTFDNGQTVALRMAADGHTLEVFDLSK